MSLLKLLRSNPDDLLRCKTLRFPAKSGKNGEQLLMGSTGQVAFDLVESGEYADFVAKPGSSDISAWAEFPSNYIDVKLQGTTFALTAPLSGCTVGALNTGMWFHRARDCQVAKYDLAPLRTERLNFIFGPPEYDKIANFYAKGDAAQVVVFGMKTSDTQWTFWAQWQKRLGPGEAQRLLWEKVGTYPKA
jgi:hypothetical protein